MLRVTDHGEVREFELSTRLSRAVGIKVSVFAIRGTLIDCGFWRARGEFTRVLDSGAVSRAILTHWHEDHSGNISILARRGIPTSIAAATRALLPKTVSLPIYRSAIWGAPPPTALPPEASDLDLEIIPTPGHSEDHVAVWDPGSETVFGGDLFLGVKASTVHSYEDPYATLASVRRVRALNPKRYFDAHRGPIRDPVNALDAKAHWLESTIGEIESGLDRGDADPVIRDRVLGREGAATWVAIGEMSKLNFVRAVRRIRASR